MKTLILNCHLPGFFSFSISDTASNRCMYFHRSSDNIKVPCNAATKPESSTDDGSFITNTSDVPSSTFSTRNTREFTNTMHPYEFPNRKTIAANISLTEHTTTTNYAHAAYVNKETKKKTS